MTARIGIPSPDELYREMIKEARKLQIGTGLGTAAMAELIGQWANIIVTHYEKKDGS